MAGLLSNALEWMTNADYYDSRRRDKQADEAEELTKSLLGKFPTQQQNPPGTASYGLVDGMQTPPQYNVTVPGTGYRGGNMSREQYQDDLQAGMTGIYGGKGMAQDIMKQGMAGQQAMNRQQQQQFFDTNNMSAYQRAQVQEQKASRLAQLGTQNFTQMKGLQGAYDKEITPYEVSINNVRSVDEMVNEAGYDDAATQQFIVSKALSTIRPGEAQMEGDIRALAKSAGFAGEVKDAWSWLVTEAARDTKILKGLHKMMRTKANMDQRSINSTRSKVQQAYRLNPQQMKVMTWGDSTSQNQYASPDAGIKWDD